MYMGGTALENEPLQHTFKVFFILTESSVWAGDDHCIESPGLCIACIEIFLNYFPKASQ